MGRAAGERGAWALHEEDLEGVLHVVGAADQLRGEAHEGLNEDEVDEEG